MGTGRCLWGESGETRQLGRPNEEGEGETSERVEVGSRFSVRVGGVWMLGFGAMQVVMPEGRDLLLRRCARDRDGGIVA